MVVRFSLTLCNLFLILVLCKSAFYTLNGSLVIYDADLFVKYSNRRIVAALNRGTGELSDAQRTKVTCRSLLVFHSPVE